MTDKDKYAQTPLFKMPEWHPLRVTGSPHLSHDRWQTPQLLDIDVCYESPMRRFSQSAVAMIAIAGTAALCWLVGKAFP